jgi:dihydroorotate dehydrogenase
VTIYDVAASFLRLLPAETAHRLTIDALKTGIARPVPDLDDPRLAVTLKRSGLRLPNPIGLAAGFDKDAEVIAPMLGFGFGFVECGTVTPRPQPGNPRPRLFRLPEDRAVINRMGFNNEGISPYVRRMAAAA